MLFNNQARAGQCDPGAGVPIPKAQSPVVPGAVGPLEQCQCLSVPSAELLSFNFFPITRKKFCSWRKREEQRDNDGTLSPSHPQHVYLHCSSAAEGEKLHEHPWFSVGKGSRLKRLSGAGASPLVQNSYR